MAYGNGLFVSVGGRQIPYTSTDGRNWQWHDYLGEVWFDGIAFGRSRFVAVGDHIGYSSDGAHWTIQEAPPTTTPRAVVLGRGTWVAVGTMRKLGDPQVLVSQDGVQWAAVRVEEEYDFHGVTYGHGVFVAVADTGVWTSPDGQEWTKQGADLANCWDVAYANREFVGGGLAKLVTSPDGVVWTKRAVGLGANDDLYAVAFGQGRFVAGGDVAFYVAFFVSGVIPPAVTEVQFVRRLSYKLPDGAMLVTIEAPYGREVVVEASEDMVNWQEIARDPCDRGEFEVYDEAAKDLKQRYYRARQAAP